MISVIDYGAAGDGVTDDTAAWNAALASGNPVITGEGRAYKITDSLVAPIMDRLEIRDCLYDFSSAATDETMIRFVTALGSPIYLTSDANYGDMTLTISDTSTLSRGDEVTLSSDGQWSDDGSEVVTKGETIRIKKVIDAYNVELMTPVDDAYLTADSAKIEKLVGHKNIRLHKVDALGAGPEEEQIAVVCKSVKGLSIIDCNFINFGKSGLYIETCTEVKIQNGSISGTRLNGYGYNIALLNANRDVIVQGINLSDGRTGVTQGGTSGVGRNILCNGVTFTGHYTAAANSKGAAANFAVVGCFITGSGESGGLGDGIRLRGRDVVVSSNILRGCRHLSVIVTLNGRKGTKKATALIANNLVDAANDIAYYVTAEGADDVEAISITGNVATWKDGITTASKGGIHVRAVGVNIQVLNVMDNTLPNCPFNNIDIRTSIGGVIDSLKQSGNHCTLTAAAATAGRRLSVVSGSVTAANVQDSDGEMIYDPVSHKWTMRIERSNRYQFDAAGIIPLNNSLRSLGKSGNVFKDIWGEGFVLADGVTEPSTSSGYAKIYVDSSDGNLKIKFGDGTVKTIVTDS